MAQAERTRRCFVVTLCCVLFVCVCDCEVQVQVDGYRIETAASSSLENGKIFLHADTDIQLRFFGQDFNSGQSVSFTNKRAKRNELCTDLRNTDVFPFIPDANTTGIAIVNLPLINIETKEDGSENEDDEDFYMICVKVGDSSEWVHQGDDHWLLFYTTEKPVVSTIFPIWIQIILIIILLVFSGLFSGLNLGLMALDQTELKILINCGSSREQRYAKRIAPLRKRGNFLLCTILLGNVLVNNTLTILMDDLTGSGYAAVLGATAGIVIFGEIMPQAVCSRYGLAIGANTIWFTKFFMLVTFPLSFPISKILDCVLGEEIGSVYNRDRLRELLRLTKTDLINDEVNIITGALQLSKKTVMDIMTQLEDVYMIDINSVLDFDTMNDIMRTGFTRIPVYETDNTNIVAILNIKDLAFIDPDDETPLKTICAFYKHPVTYVFEDMKLSEILQQFKQGKAHMAFVRNVHTEGPGDPYYETTGVVTLEDVIEEIIQSEIVDETDTITDNRKRTRRENQARDFSIFKPDERDMSLNFPKMAPQMALATYQYLHTSVPAFKSEMISELVLQRLIKQNIMHELRIKDQKDPSAYIYQNGKKCDYFIMILQGRVEVSIGKEQMTFESGPFAFFGVQALTGVLGSFSSMQSLSSQASNADLMYTKNVHYTPDFTVKMASDYLQFIKIRRHHYEAARRATAMERMMKKGGEDYFTKEWNRVTNAHHDNISIKTEPDSMAATPDKSDSSLLEGKDLATSPASITMDGDVRKRSSTQGSDGGVVLALHSGTDEEALDAPLIDNIPVKDSSTTAPNC